MTSSIPLKNEMKCTAMAPTRIDLAGGTLDIWPLAPIVQEKCDLWNEPVVTVNVAIDLYASAEVTLSPSSSLQWTFEDRTRAVQQSGTNLSGENGKDYPLHRSVTRYFTNLLLERGLGKVHVASHALAPRGSGLGGSSSLVIAMIAAFENLLGQRFDRREMCLRAQNIEAGLLGGLAGNQDHFAAAHGGVQAVRHSADGTFTGQVTCAGHEVLNHLVLAYSGVQHLSVFNNWLVLEKVLTGDRETILKCAGIARCANALPAVLHAQDWKAMAQIITEEWKNRRALADGISTPELDRMYAAAMEAGASGGKVCGAGGGGVLVMVIEDPVRRLSVETAIANAGGIVLKAGFAGQGVRFVDSSVVCGGRTV